MDLVGEAGGEAGWAPVPGPCPQSLSRALPPLILKSHKSRSCVRCCFSRGPWVDQGALTRHDAWSCLWAQGSQRVRWPMGAHTGAASYPASPKGPTAPEKGSPGLAVPSPPSRQGLVWGSHRGISSCFWCRGDSAKLWLLALVERGSVNARATVLGQFVPVALGARRGTRAEKGLSHPSRPCSQDTRTGD